MCNRFDSGTEGGKIGCVVYHSTVTKGLAVCYAKLIKWVFGGTSRRVRSIYTNLLHTYDATFLKVFSLT